MDHHAESRQQYPIEPSVIYPGAAVQVSATAGHAPVIPACAGAPAPVYVPGIGRVLAYPEQQPAPAVVPAGRQPLPVWVRSIAVLMPTAAASLALGAWGLSFAVAALEAVASALWAATAATVGVGVVVAGVASAARSKSGSSAQSTASTGPITATATSTAQGKGLFSRPTAQATATVTVHQNR